MGSDESSAILINSREQEYKLKKTKKILLADKILDHLVKYLI